MDPWVGKSSEEGVGYLLQYSWASPVAQMVENLLQCGRPGSIPRLRETHGRGHGNPLQFSYLRNPYGERSLASYSPWYPKELNTTDQLSIYMYLYIYIYTHTYTHTHKYTHNLNIQIFIKFEV